jgi:hypothetical protein
VSASDGSSPAPLIVLYGHTSHTLFFTCSFALHGGVGVGTGVGTGVGSGVGTGVGALPSVAPRPPGRPFSPSSPPALSVLPCLHGSCKPFKNRFGSTVTPERQSCSC